MKKINVGIIFGGRSTEYNISLKSAKNIIQNINKDKFIIIPIGIDKENNWHIFNIADFFLDQNNLKIIKKNDFMKDIFLFSLKKYRVIPLNILLKLDIVFPIIHGKFGEDGLLQGFLEMIGIPFVGSKTLASSIGMNKIITKKLLRDSGLKVAPFLILDCLTIKFFSFKKICKKFGLPFFVKPTNQGSSIGVSKVIDKTSFDQAINLAFKYDNTVLVESAILGRELECAILGNENPKVSPCGEILANEKFYSYKRKYINIKEAKIIYPANISKQINEKIKKTVLKVFKVLNCCDMVRVDMFLTKNNRIIINEINTIPGFTDISMYPKLWEISGINCSDLISKLIELAIVRYKKNFIK